MKCIVCGRNIDPDIARHNTGMDDCCDRCSLERRSEYRRIKGIIDESTVYGNDCRDDLTACYEMNRVAKEALSTTSEPTVAERVRERYKNAEHLNATTSGATAEYYLGVMNGITDTLNDLGITIPGINAPEGAES